MTVGGRVAAIVLTVVVVGATASSVAGARGPVGAGDDVRGEADWILVAQLPDGSIASHPDRTFVNPYLAGFAAIGLAAATRATDDPVYAEGAWRAVEWHASRMDALGYVTDHHVERVDGIDGTRSERLVSTGAADATDAYAGLFLLALEAAHDAAPDRARLRALAPAIRLAIDAIRSTQRPDGLTGARPDWMVAYLMNDAEAYAGLRAAARLVDELGDRKTAHEASRAAKRIRRAVDRLWNRATGSLDWAVHPDGARQSTAWAQLYPDALSQVWAVRFGLLDGKRARTVLDGFRRSHPNVADPRALALIDGRVQPIGYWAGTGAVLGAVDAAAPERALFGTAVVAAATSRAWPFSVQVAADLIDLRVTP